MLSDILKIKKGLTCIIGSGGKTTLMYALADELSEKGRVIVCTSTKIYPPKHIPTIDACSAEMLEMAFLKSRVICVGKPAEGGKLTAPDIPFADLKSYADYVICEADGSKGLPLKAHAAHEPVIPEGCDDIIGVAGVSGINKKTADVCHREDIFAKLAGLTVNDTASPKAVADVINKEGLCRRLIINQAEGAEYMKLAEETAAYIDIPVYAGEIRKGQLICLHL